LVWEARWMGWEMDDANFWSIGLLWWIGVGVSGAGELRSGRKLDGCRRI